MEHIKTISDVYQHLGINEQLFLSDIPYRTIEMAKFARSLGVEDLDMDKYPYYPLQDFNIYAIVYVLNDGWIPKYVDIQENKFYPYFSLVLGFGTSGSGHSYDGVGVYGSYRLCFKSANLAEYAGNTFISEYKKFLINK